MKSPAKALAIALLLFTLPIAAATSVDNSGMPFAASDQGDRLRDLPASLEEALESENGEPAVREAGDRSRTDAGPERS